MSMTLFLSIALTVLVIVIVMKDVRKDRAAPADGGIVKQVLTDQPWTPPTPTRPAPPMPSYRLKDDRYAPRKGDMVMVTGLSSNGIDTHSAIVTRAYTGRLINIVLLPDAAMPLPMTNVELFETKAAADYYLNSVRDEGARNVVAAWPHHSNDAGSLK